MAKLLTGTIPRAVEGAALDTVIEGVNGIGAEAPGAVAFTVGAEVVATHTVTISGQLKDSQGVAVASARAIKTWISATAGAVPAATAPDGAVTLTKGTLLKELTSKVLHELVTDANGQFTFTVVDSGTKDFYLNAAYGGKVSTSAKMSFAA
jgi:hypothetical protein